VFFLPIYYFNLRFSFMSHLGLTSLQEGIFNVAMIYALTRLISLLFAIPTAKILIKFGIRQGFVMGHLFYALFVLCLYLSKNNINFIFLATIINGLQVNLFWNSYYYSLSRNSDQNKIGANLGIINFLLNLLAMISPALGGLIIIS